MSPKPRKPENKALPARWRFKHGAYYYRVPESERDRWDGKSEFRLGKTTKEAYAVWSQRLEYLDNIISIGDLLDRYALEVIPTKAPKTQESNQISVRMLKPVFGDMPIAALKPSHAYRYLDLRGRRTKSGANRDFEVLSHALTKAVEWGLIDRNPVKGQVKKHSIKRRERYVEDWELEEAMKVASPMLRAYIVLKLLTGLRRGDLLRLRASDCTDEGIQVTTSKTGKSLLIEWTDELREAVEAALAARPKDIVPWLFCTNRGKCYASETGSSNAFDSLWQRFMTRATEKTKLVEPFQEKDLRKKTASDMAPETAQKLLGHATISTTERHYRLRGSKVIPHSLKGAKALRE